MTYVFSLCSATDAYPFCVCKNKAEEKEPHIEKRGAQLISQTKLFRKGGWKRTLPRRRLSRAVEAKTMLWGNWPPHPLFNRRYPTSIKGARASEATIHAPCIECLKCLKKRSSRNYRSFRPLRSCAVGNAEDVRLRFYRQFRLCFTTTDFGGRKGIGLSPYPYQISTRKESLNGQPRH